MSTAKLVRSLYIEVRRVRFVYCKACMRLVDVRRVRFDYRKTRWSLVEVWGVRFDCSKACRLVEVRESVLTAKMLLESCRVSGSPFCHAKSMYKACRDA